MRDFRDAKAMARTLRAALAAKGLKVTISESLELIAKAFGASDWNTLSAAIKAEPARPATSPPPASAAPDAAPPPEPAVSPQPPRGFAGFNPNLEQTLHRAVALAAARKHPETTIEHLLLALTEDVHAAEVMRACKVNIAVLGRSLVSHVGAPIASPTGDGEAPAPSGAFQRVIQRSVIHVQSAGLGEVTGANVLVAIFSERDSRAARLLREQGLDRYDAVNFIAHGVRKDGRAA